MSILPLTLTAERSIPGLPAARSSASIVPLSRGLRPAKPRPVNIGSEQRSAAAAIEAGTRGWPDPGGVIIDLACAARDRHSTQQNEDSSIEKRAGLRPADLAVMAYVLVSVAFYPAMMWLFASLYLD